MNSGLFHIGNSAFRDCTSLTFVSLHSTVTSIGDYAFDNCSSLYLTTLPIDITSIGIGTFRNCKRLSSITIPNNVSIIGNAAFFGCSALFGVTIPNSVISIGDSAFEECHSLGRIDIPDSVTSIGISAFSNCIGLESVNIANSVTSIGDFAFKECNNLTTFRVRWDTPLAINANVFEDVSIENIPLTIPADAEIAYQTAPVWQDFGLFLKSFNDGVIEYTVTDIPNTYVSVKKYDDTCPTGDLTIPETITNNGTTYTIKKVEEQAFTLCSDLTGVTFPDSLTSIGYYAFGSCTSLKSVIIPNNVTDIGESTFHNCSNLTSVTFPEGLTEIGRGVFVYCTKLTDVILPESLTSIGGAAFQDCKNILSISIPDGVTSILSSAFSNCSSLTSVTIPESVTSIGTSAFRGCSNLTSVTVNWDTPLTINANVFQGVSIGDIPLNVPAGTEAAYRAAAVWKDFDWSALSLLDFAMTSIRLYPNPTSSFLKIDLNGSSELKKATIYNNLGQLVSEESETKISVSNYSKGLYFAEIETTQGKVTKKFLVE